MFEELVNERLGDVAFVAEELTKETLGQLRHRFAVIDIAGREVKSEQITLVTDDQMQLEAEKPAH